MKKLLFIILAAAGLSLSATSCWKENLPEAGAARHQVTDLKAVPGDEEAQLTWSMPEGWNPTEYIITYTDGDKIVLKKFKTSCVFCNADENLVTFRDKLICNDCIKKISLLG